MKRTGQRRPKMATGTGKAIVMAMLILSTPLLWLTTPISAAILDDTWFSSQNKQDTREQTWTYGSSIPV